MSATGFHQAVRALACRIAPTCELGTEGLRALQSIGQKEFRASGTPGLSFKIKGHGTQ